MWAVAYSSVRMWMLGPWYGTTAEPDEWGNILEDFISRNDITVQNKAGYPPTIRNRGSACLDVTMKRNSVRVANWSATHDLTPSDHALISIDLITRNEVPGTEFRYNYYNTNWTQFCKTLKKSRDKMIRDLECPDVETNFSAEGSLW